MNSPESSSQNPSAPQSFLMECCWFGLLSASLWLAAVNRIDLVGRISQDGLRQLSYFNLSLSIVFVGYVMMRHLRHRRLQNIQARIKATIIAALTLMAFPIGCKLWLPAFQVQAVAIASFLGLTTLILLYRDTFSTTVKAAIKKLFLRRYLIVWAIFLAFFGWIIADLFLDRFQKSVSFIIPVHIGTISFCFGLPVMVYTHINSYIISNHRRNNSGSSYCLKELALVNLACSPILLLSLLKYSIRPVTAYSEFIFLLVSTWLLAMAMGLIIAQVHPKIFHGDAIDLRPKELKFLRSHRKMVGRTCLFLLTVVVGFSLLPWFSTGLEEIGYSRLISTIPARIKSLEHIIPVKPFEHGRPDFLDNLHIGFGSRDDSEIFDLGNGKRYSANEADRTKLTALEEDPLRPRFIRPIGSEDKPLGYPRLPIPGSTLESPNHQFRLITKEGNRNMCYLIATGSDKVLLQLPGETEIESTQFSPDSQRLAYSDRAGTLYVWNLASLSR
jgi:hypothetical protein